MFNSELSRAIENFATLMLPLSEKDLEREWKWKDHDEEGIRFAFFVTLQELRHLTVTLSTLRPPQTSAQRILGQYHASYMDLQAALLGLSQEDADKPPAAGEWSVREAYSHMLGAEINFTIAVRYALEQHRAGVWTNERISDEDESRLAGMTEAEYQALRKGPLRAMLAYHRTFHPEIITEFSKITNEELNLPSTFWEETRFPIKHRLHRYEAHLIQHTVQIDKTLVGIGQAPSESKRLIRKIYAALAEAEGMMIGAEKMDDAVIRAIASSIAERTREIEALIR
ncbi:MAG: DinB family protein [Anaerolineae bacterium]|nr:DinB family protein [Anaerolineae bacterium]MCI0610138.1 DinB family protein [Anaerolineae bacterium]